jgi:acetyltransferase
MKGDNLMVITNGGGVGVLASDAADRYGIPLHFAPEEVQAELKKYMPEYGSAKNPADLTGMGGEEEYYQSIRSAYSHEWVDGLVVLVCEVPMFEPMDIARGIQRAVVDSGITDKPMAVSIIGGTKAQEAMDWLLQHGIPCYFAPDTAVNAMAALRDFARLRQIRDGDMPPAAQTGEAAAREVIAEARADGRSALTECESKKVFAAYDLPIATTNLATTEIEAIDMAREIGFPIVMKIASPDILHKTDAGGVVVNIKDETAARNAYNQILENAREYNPNADIHGVVIQEMAPYGTEVIIGSVNDPTFGPTVMFGLGGIFVEVLKDVTFRVAPITADQAERMLDEIRGAPVLAGVRGERPRDRKALAGILSRYSQMILDLADEINETDANPILVYSEGRGVKIVDARIVLK